ncbi:DNA-binding protein, partial [Escherichia coli]|nr:DNA-binding protein [Escherichia coli]
EQINIYEYINEKQLEKLKPQGNLRIAIEKFWWNNKPITA